MLEKKFFSRLSILIFSVLLVAGSVSYFPKSAKAYTSGTSLNNRVIFQSFSLYMPYESNMYKILSAKGNELKDWGITDIWLPPAYRSFNMARYMEGYAIADRYDLGEFNQGPNNTRPTKYGTSDELKSMVSVLHANGLKVQEDLVPNQVLGLSKREAVYVTRVDQNGNLFKNPYTTGLTTQIRANLYLAYTKGGGEGQAKYGYIKEWNKKYFNGTSVQGQGMDRVMKDSEGIPYRYFGPNNPKNYLPSWLDEAAAANKINTVDTYLAVDGWYAAKDASTSDNYWKPMLMHDPGYLKYMKSHGYSSVDDILNGDNGQIASLTDAYIASQPGYGFGSEERSFKNDNSGSDDQDQFLFVKKNGTTFHNLNNTISGQKQFLLGMDIDNGNPTVQKEQIHWMNWLLDTYQFDGFRIDAASHYDKQVLLDEGDVMKQHFGSHLNDHLSYIETYESAGTNFENANGNPQLMMDYALFYSLQNALGKNSPSNNLSTIATNAVVNRASAGTANATPNWSFVNNHDQEKNRVNRIMLDQYGIKPGTHYGTSIPKAFQDLYDKKTEAKALDIYEKDMESTVKKYAPSNVPSQYAYVLTNKDTVPTVFYGDLYKTNASYMSERTPYYDTIVKLLKVRKNYAYGNQQVTNYKSNTSSTAGKDLISSVRYGNDRNTGVATVIGNNPKTDTTIKVNMGSRHANQLFEDATGFHNEKLVTDSKGVLTVHVKGTQNARVKGYLGVWIPAKKAATPKQGPALQYGKYVTITNKHYAVYQDFNWKKKNVNAVNKTYLAKVQYHHSNGSTYLSLYDGKGKWAGYINAKAAKTGSGKQGAAIQYGKSVKVTSKNYAVYQNFNWKKKNIRAVNKTYLAKYIYYHINGLSYLSLYDNKGKWIGYINAKAVKIK
ncbi:alpha amylase, catalytic domain protein [Heyndrickxia coagulans]|uniref:dextransucrase n=1 Tax=Heyndrickxia coagulans TaxID=1398 RepID=A0A133L2H9_HEYCO|nr:alpha amylase, catalytic domain protein [Heyndrickxia coagulans]